MIGLREEAVSNLLDNLDYADLFVQFRLGKITADELDRYCTEYEEAEMTALLQRRRVADYRDVPESA